MRFVRQVMKPGENLGHQADAARRRSVVTQAGADGRRVARVGGGEIDAAVFGAEQGSRRLRGRRRGVEILRLAGRLEQRQRGAGHRGEIVEHSGSADPALSPGMDETAAPVA